MTPDCYCYHQLFITVLMTAEVISNARGLSMAYAVLNHNFIMSQHKQPDFRSYKTRM